MRNSAKDAGDNLTPWDRQIAGRRVQPSRGSSDDPGGDDRGGARGVCRDGDERVDVLRDADGSTR